jgi:hypothetical protein
VTSALAKLEALFQQVSASHISPIDTLKVGIKVENHLNQYHCNAVAVCSDPEMTYPLNAMMQRDLDHVGMLEKALAKLSAEKDA